MAEWIRSGKPLSGPDGGVDTGDEPLTKTVDGITYVGRKSARGVVNWYPLSSPLQQTVPTRPKDINTYLKGVNESDLDPNQVWPSKTDPNMVEVPVLSPDYDPSKTTGPGMQQYRQVPNPDPSIYGPSPTITHTIKIPRTSTINGSLAARRRIKGTIHGQPTTKGQPPAHYRCAYQRTASYGKIA